MNTAPQKQTIKACRYSRLNQRPRCHSPINESNYRNLAYSHARTRRQVMCVVVGVLVVAAAVVVVRLLVRVRDRRSTFTASQRCGRSVRSGREPTDFIIRHWHRERHHHKHGKHTLTNTHAHFGTGRQFRTVNAARCNLEMQARASRNCWTGFGFLVCVRTFFGDGWTGRGADSREDQVRTRT